MTSSAGDNSRKREASPDIDRSQTLPLPKAARLMDDVDISEPRVAIGTDKDATGTGNDAAGHQAIVDNVVASSAADNDNPSQIKEHIGNLFAALDDSVLIHACNTAGSWGGGIAVAFREHYPEAYQLYNKHCTKVHNVKTNPVPTGTCLLIPPVETEPNAPKHWIACLFTSAKYGKAKDPPHMILQHTGPAFKDLLVQLSAQPTMEQLRMCKINAGLFAVPWEDTKKVVENVLATDAPQVFLHVFTPASLPPIHTPAKAPAKKAISKKQSSAKGAPAKTQTAPKGQSSLNSFLTKK